MLVLYSYSREIPSRFKKDIVKAAMQQDSGIAMEGLQRVLANINMQDRVSPRHMQVIFRELGGEAGIIPSERMMSII